MKIEVTIIYLAANDLNEDLFTTVNSFSLLTQSFRINNSFLSKKIETSEILTIDVLSNKLAKYN